MSGRTAQVFLHKVPVGSLLEDEQGMIEFRLSTEYRQARKRPVLGQWFEDHLDARPRGARPGELPAFFENLIPEGYLAVLVRERLAVRPEDDFGLLCAVGGDLPGAITVQLQEGDAPALAPRPRSADEPEPGLRFSLAGVQLKFSMIKLGERFTMPGRDGRGDWIAKISLDAFPELCANEWVTMAWARAAGFAVPATELRVLADLLDVPYEGAQKTPVFLIQRYDREPNEVRIHQEDFQQVVSRPAGGKYDDITYDGLVLLATKIVGEESFAEVLRRLTFVVASGNNDAHMKNWSLLYPGSGIRAELSPLYDQVFTAQWPQFSARLALKLGGTKEFAAIDLARFRELARRVGRSPQDAEEIVTATLAAITRAWATVAAHPAVTADYRAALRRHWRKVPLLRPLALP